MADKQVGFCASRAAGLVGIFLLLCGFGNSVCGSLYFVKGITDDHSFFMRCGHGIWSGILFVITGSLGIAVWVKRKTSLAIAFTVVVILAVVVAAGQCTMAVVVIYSPSVADIVHTECKPYNGSCGSCQESIISGRRLCDSSAFTEYLFLAILVISSVAVVLCWVGSVIGCIGACLTPSREKSHELVITAPGTVVASKEFDFLAPTSPSSPNQPVYINPLCDRPSRLHNHRVTPHGRSNSGIDPFDERL